MTFLTATEVMAAPDDEYYHFASGMARGGPWRSDSIYLRIDDFELIRPPFEATNAVFVRHGISVFDQTAVVELKRALDRFIAEVDAVDDPGAVLGAGAGHLPSVAVFPDWQAAQSAIRTLVRTVDVWIDDNGLEQHGMSVIRQ